ncbi:MAG TPA: FtsX-like permease family protein, partial [Thermoplasmata archaeon]|nr:FtsX-like permease family protein [Thermoplasmata archaeon]
SDLQLVVGVARTNGSTGALVDAADTIQVALDGPAASSPGGSARIAAEIQALAPYYEVSTLTEEVHSLQQATAVLTGFYVAISSIGLAVGLVFLAVVLVRQVETERRSLGIRRALGVRAREIASMMVARSLVLGAAGAAGGVATGGLLVEGLASYGNASVREATRLAIFDPVVLGSLVGGVLALAALASAAATRAALRLSIPEALR